MRKSDAGDISGSASAISNVIKTMGDAATNSQIIHREGGFLIHNHESAIRIEIEAAASTYQLLIIANDALLKKENNSSGHR
jgi:hypothetical protein